MTVMAEPDLRNLIRQAIETSDASLMRDALLRLVGGGHDALSPEAEYGLRSPDYLMEMPQSGERIRGRDAMRSMQEQFPSPPDITVRRVTGAGTTWVLEGVNDYGGGDIWHVVVVLEFTPEGNISRDTRYYAKPFDPPGWRAGIVELMEDEPSTSSTE
jgi:hypothetical protein